MEIIVSKNDRDAGKRLDLYLSLHLPALTRSQIKKTIESNQVLVDSEICYKAGYKIKGGEVIIFPESVLKENVYSTKLQESMFDLEIIEEDEDYMFINKPSGLTVHPTSTRDRDTLVNKLLSLKKNLPGDNILRPGIVHRLDKDTSGVIIIAKTPKALWWISKQFAERKVKKEYLSLGLSIGGHDKNLVEGKEFTYTSNITRGSVNRKKFYSEPLDSKEGRFSSTDFKVNKIFDIDTKTRLICFSVFPLTGRTHQIRVHQRALNLPVLGDSIYLSKKEWSRSESIFRSFNIKSRLYLHARTVTFENYNKKMYSISAQIPQNIKLLSDNENPKSEHKYSTKATSPEW